MSDLLRRMNPAVPRAALAPVAGVLWGMVSIMLLVRSLGWFSEMATRTAALTAAGGLLMAAFLIPRAFMPLVKKNLARLALRPDRTCIFSVFAIRSWVMVLVMSVGGGLLRRSGVPREPLAVSYLAMAFCLGTGAILYFRAARRGG